MAATPTAASIPSPARGGSFPRHRAHASVMTSSGMYDYAGGWTYRVIPAKSGVGGGIIAALPGQWARRLLALLDDHGNSVRGLQVCEALSSEFELHFLKRHVDIRSCDRRLRPDRDRLRRTRQPARSRFSTSTTTRSG